VVNLLIYILIMLDFSLGFFVMDYLAVFVVVF
jgi:hypothetical protein